MTKYIAHMFVLAAAVTAAGCTMANVDPPPLSGPSEMSLSLTIMANPDILSLDGASQTLVTVEVRDVNGQLVPNVPLRVEILADGEIVDFGRLSARTLVTGSNGRATFTYTAPSFVSGEIPNVQLSVTPTGTDASSHLRRLLTVRLVPPGGINTNPTARFTFIPESPAEHTDVRFDGSTSTGGLGAIITRWEWDFGDGETATGMTPTHQYDDAGTYLVRLRVTDSNGSSNETAPTPITVVAGVPPTAEFVFSPTEPVAGQPTFFNATQSTAGPGRRIVRYQWNWGDGKPNSSGSTVSHTFDAPGTYVVVLTVTDDVGQVARSTAEVTVS